MAKNPSPVIWVGLSSIRQLSQPSPTPSRSLSRSDVFLQGQFRNTLVSYDSDELNHSIVEAWVGYRVGLSSGYSITYSIRGHTSELKRGIGNRNVVWGSLQFNRNFN